MKYLSVCSGIEAASVAWHSLGWNPIAFSEIEPYPSKVLAHRFPSVPNLGDMTKYHEWPELSPNLIVGGTPCQAFSIAGMRQGLADPRGNLTLTFLGLVDRYMPRWVVWENVPGVLSDRTNAFGNLLAGLGQLGYGWAYRVLDAQYFGLAQRRKRVFVVAHLGDWSRAAAVLFEPDCLRGNPPPSRQPGQGIAGTLAARTSGGGGLGTDLDLNGGRIPIQEPGKRTGASTSDRGYGVGIGSDGDPMFTLQAGAVHGVAHKQWPVEVAPTLNASFGEKRGLEDQHALGGGAICPLRNASQRPTRATMQKTETLIPMRQGGFFDEAKCITGDVAHTLKAEGADASEDGTGRGTPIVFHPTQDPIISTDGTTHALGCGSKGGNATAAVAFSSKDYGGDATEELSPTIRAVGGYNANGGGPPAVAQRMSVRRLTPRECEKLQGFTTAINRVTVAICLDRPNNCVRVEIKCRRLQSNAPLADGDARKEAASSADVDFQNDQECQGSAVHIHVRSSYEPAVVGIRNQGKWLLCAPTAEYPEWFHRHTDKESIAHALALTALELDQTTPIGMAGSPESMTLSILRENGSSLAGMFGQGSGEYVSDVGIKAKEAITFITSKADRDTKKKGSIDETWLYSALPVIASFIPEKTSQENLFFTIDLERDWTAIPTKGKPAEKCPDGPRYKAIGNSMAVPVMRWIGKRIDAVDLAISSP